jgi:hypothetical protein
MKRFLLKNRSIIQSSSTIIIALTTAFYVNLITGSYLEQGKNGNIDFILIIKELGWWNILALIIIVVLFFQIYLSKLEKRFIKSNINDIVHQILKAACRSLIYPENQKHIRAIVTIRNGSSGTRKTKYTYNASCDPERVAEYPNDFGITGEAFRTRSVILKQLPPDHHDSYHQEIQDNILPKVKTVLAAPILDSENVNELPLGVLAFDSSLAIRTLKWNNNEARKIAQYWADVIAKIINYSEY